MPPERPLKTSDVARAVGVHPNTIRLFEEWGFLPDVPRNPSNNYRQFSPRHIQHGRLARTLLQWPYPAGKEPLETLVRQAANGACEQALAALYDYGQRAREELARAEAAAAYLQRWVDGETPSEPVRRRLWIGQAAERLDVTRDQLRNWERNGLLRVPRDPSNGYRLYGAAELGRLRVIRLLHNAGYSHMAILRVLLALEGGRREDLAQVLDTPRPDEEIIGVADQWLTTLREVCARMDEAVAILQGLAT